MKEISGTPVTEPSAGVVEITHLVQKGFTALLQTKEALWSVSNPHVCPGTRAADPQWKRIILAPFQLL